MELQCRWEVQLRTSNEQCTWLRIRKPFCVWSGWPGWQEKEDKTECILLKAYKRKESKRDSVDEPWVQLTYLEI